MIERFSCILLLLLVLVLFDDRMSAFLTIPTKSNRIGSRPSSISLSSTLEQQQEEEQEEEEQHLHPSSPHTSKVGLYIHIPYCRQRCRYCDFAIVPIGNHVQIIKEEAQTTGNNDDKRK